MTIDTQNRLSIFRAHFGLWNVFFLCEFLLAKFGYLQLDLIFNGCLLLAVLLPLPKYVGYVRNLLCLVFAGWLLYQESLSASDLAIRRGLSRLENAPIDTLGSLFSNPDFYQMFGGCLLILVLYFFLRNFVRVGAITVGYFLFLVAGSVFNFQQLTPMVPADSVTVAATDTSRQTTIESDVTRTPISDTYRAENYRPVNRLLLPAQRGDASNRNIDMWLEDFYNAESQRQVSFPSQLGSLATPFDIVFIEVASLSWDDLQADRLANHPVFSKFDIRFNQFNSVTSYSSGAMLRLLRSSCGQASNQDLYSGRRLECETLGRLDDLGYQQHLFADNAGQSDRWLEDAKLYGALKPTLESQLSYKAPYENLSGEKVYATKDVFDSYLSRVNNSANQRNISILRFSLLDSGIKKVGAKNQLTHKEKTEAFLDEVNQFLDALQRSGKSVLVVFVPESGAAVRGDNFQISGLRGIPSRHITNVPVLAKFVNLNRAQGRVQVNSPVSYQAIAELLSRILGNDFFSHSSPLTTQELVRDLPQTWAVSDNGEAAVVEFMGKDYVRLDNGEWFPYGE